jgi:hypothetical protein
MRDTYYDADGFELDDEFVRPAPRRVAQHAQHAPREPRSPRRSC